MKHGGALGLTLAAFFFQCSGRLNDEAAYAHAHGRGREGRTAEDERGAGQEQREAGEEYGGSQLSKSISLSVSSPRARYTR